MNAVILAAGVGRRLYTITQHHPKCLLTLGGQPLLIRYLENLERLGIVQATIVVGYKQEQIREAVAGWRGHLRIHFLVNDDFERGSIGSLWVAREALDDDTVIMDADVLFHPSILEQLINSPHPNALLMDETVEQATEECMVVIHHNRVIALTKQMPDVYDEAGEGIGFLKLNGKDAPRLIHSIGQWVRQGMVDMEYEDALIDFFQSTPVGVVKIGGLPWIEIDFPEDVVRAQNDVLLKFSEHDSD